jgi:hypothetical protein
MRRQLVIGRLIGAIDVLAARYPSLILVVLDHHLALLIPI